MHAASARASKRARPLASSPVAISEGPSAALPSAQRSSLSPLPCIQPAFRNQVVITQPGRYKLDESGNSIALITQVLLPDQLEKYVSEALKVERFSGRSGFGQKPRREICYTTDGASYRYSGVQHPTRRYPAHVLEVLPVLLSTIATTIPGNKYLKLSNGVDIIYSDEFPRGGSISAHSDDEDNWGLVLVFSVGQSRWLRVRSHSGRWWNVQMTHNSVVAMHGATFQAKYTHQVDKLRIGEKVGVRLSLNLRYKEEH